MFVTDEGSATCLLSEHRILAAPIGVRPARNRSEEHTLPYVLSPEQATLVLRRNLADVHLGLVNRGEDGDHRPIYGAHVRFGNEGETASRPGSVEQPDVRGRTLHWQYPETPEQARSMAVFQDLWKRGVYVSGGSNYGADYVVYDDLPTHSHSVAAVLVGRGRNGELSPAEVSGFARVQQAVAKRAVIASPPPPPATQYRGSKVMPKRGEHDRGEKKWDSDVSPCNVGAGGGGENGGVRYVTLQFDSVSGRTL
ncbi:unnamed protein product [Sphacelaria rigidula]